MIGLDLIKALIDRDKVVRPITSTDCGIRVLRISGEAKKIDACAMASGKDRGSSAITGHPNTFVNCVTSSTVKPPRSCPITTTPRAPTKRSVPGLVRATNSFGATLICESQSDESSGNKGSSNCRFK